MYAEEEAKKKWCPMARETDTSLGSYNRVNGLPAKDALCLASECMSWRRATTKKKQLDGTYKSSTNGYCGLGGKP